MLLINSKPKAQNKLKGSQTDYFYNDFIYEATLKLDRYIRHLHLAYTKRIELINIIDKNKDFYNNIGIDISPIYNPDYFGTIKYDRKQYNSNLLKMSFIKSFNNINHYKIHFLNRKIKTYNIIRQIPRQVYVNLQREYNSEVASFILKGNSFSIGNGLGCLKLDVFRNPRGNTSKTIDWKSSLKLKKELEDAGYEVMSKDNPHGMQYVLFYDNTYCNTWLHWERRNSKIVHKWYYKFVFAQNNNYSITALKYNNIEEIFSDKRIGITERLSAINIYYPEHIKKLMKYE